MDSLRFSYRVLTGSAGPTTLAETPARIANGQLIVRPAAVPVTNGFTLFEYELEVEHTGYAAQDVIGLRWDMRISGCGDKYTDPDPFDPYSQFFFGTSLTLGEATAPSSSPEYKGVWEIAFTPGATASQSDRVTAEMKIAGGHGVADTTPAGGLRADARYGMQRYTLNFSNSMLRSTSYIGSQTMRVLAAGGIAPANDRSLTFSGLVSKQANTVVGNCELRFDNFMLRVRTP